MFGKQGGKAPAPTFKNRTDASTAGGDRSAPKAGSTAYGKATGGTGANNKLPK